MLPGTRQSRNPTLRRCMVFAAIALGAWALAMLPRVAARGGSFGVDWFFYDTYYRTRSVEKGATADVVIVAVDQQSLTAVERQHQRGWPWPREFWGYIAKYLSDSGAKVVTFDMLFSEVSAYQKETGDDDAFAEAINAVAKKTPVVFGSEARPDGTFLPLAPKIASPHLGAVNVGHEKVFRRYIPDVNGKGSLAVETVRAGGDPCRLDASESFLLHYYGPHTGGAGQTFRYVPAALVLGAAVDPAGAAKLGVTPDTFRGKLVLIGGIATGTYDLKSSPLAAEFPGVETQATAVLNLLRGQRVTPVSAATNAGAALIAALVATGGVIFPRRAWAKLIGPALATAGVLAGGILLFRAHDIVWLSPTDALLAIILATPIAFAWTYFAEDRQRRFMLKALSKVVSPAIAEELAQNPQRLQLGTIRTPLTLLFTDLANFTDLTEAMDVEKVGEMLNRYLGEMSDQVLRQDGTLDKYIGDAVMCFWNAPLPQPDHAACACRAALAMARRESEIAGELAAYTDKKIFTRIGINTAPVAVGFVGSAHLFNYTALGDGVNLASRLEGANKIYGTKILLSESTAREAGDGFYLRKLDALRVKGKTRPMGVYELLGEKTPDGPDAARMAELIGGYEAAFARYQQQEWDAAEQILLELLKSLGEDAPSRMLLRRIAGYRASPPEQGWDGTYQAKDK